MTNCQCNIVYVFGLTTELNLKGVSVKAPETRLDLPLWIEAIEGGQQAT